MPRTAQGTFDVRTSLQPRDDAGGPFERIHLAKGYHGDLVATGKGHMLGVQSPDQASGGYVVLELISGTLDGRRGSFMLQHSGYMARGAMTMKATVIPDSGTEELAGIAGTLTITIENKQHRYSLEYTLPG
jgi:hypothetical protein